MQFPIRQHRQTGGVIAPVLQAPQAFHQNWDDIALGHRADYAAHRHQPL